MKSLLSEEIENVLRPIVAGFTATTRVKIQTTPLGALGVLNLNFAVASVGTVYIEQEEGDNISNSSAGQRVTDKNKL